MIQVVVLFEIEVQLLPEEIGLLNCDFLVNLTPITSFLELFDYMAREISLSHCVSETSATSRFCAININSH